MADPALGAQPAAAETSADISSSVLRLPFHQGFDFTCGCQGDGLLRSGVAVRTSTMATSARSSPASGGDCFQPRP